MKEGYFTPKNEEELEELVGKLVGVIINNSSEIRQMTYAGIVRNMHEFLEPTERGNIAGLRKRRGNHGFSDVGINLETRYSQLDVKVYGPQDIEYSHRLNLMGISSDVATKS